MLLAAERQLDDARLQRLAGDERLFVAERSVVDPQAAAADLTARFAGRGDQPSTNESGQRAKPGVEFRPGNVDRRQAFGELAFLEGLAGGGGRGVGGRAPMQKRGRLVGQRLLRFVDLGAGQAFEPADFAQRQKSEQLQEPADVGVVDIAPELPVVVGREHGLIEPDAPAAVLPILAPDAMVISGVVSA